MQKRNPTTAGTHPRCGVHELEPSGAAPFERRVEVRHPVAHMVDPRAAPGQEPCDGTVFGFWFQQFHLGAAEPERDDPGAVRALGRARLEAQDVPVESQCFLDAAHGDSDMGDLGKTRHGADSLYFTGDLTPRAPRRVTQGNRFTVPPLGGADLLGEADEMADKNTVEVTDDSFGSMVEGGKGLVLVDFWAEWCGPCRAIAPSLEELASAYQGQATIAKLDVDANQRTPMRFNVRSIPTLMFFKDGKHVDTVVGGVPKQVLDSKIRQHLPDPAAA